MTLGLAYKKNHGEMRTFLISRFIFKMHLTLRLEMLSSMTRWSILVMLYHTSFYQLGQEMRPRLSRVLTMITWMERNTCPDILPNDVVLELKGVTPVGWFDRLTAELVGLFIILRHHTQQNKRGSLKENPLSIWWNNLQLLVYSPWSLRERTQDIHCNPL